PGQELRAQLRALKMQIAGQQLVAGHHLVRLGKTPRQFTRQGRVRMMGTHVFSVIWPEMHPQRHGEQEACGDKRGGLQDAAE
ncbi:hypothetical protein C1T15_28520, partial [Escherichia coli]